MRPKPIYRFNAAEALNFLVCFSGGITNLVEDDYGVKTDIVADPGSMMDDVFISRLKAKRSRGVTEATIRRATRFLDALHRGFIFEASALLSEDQSAMWDVSKQNKSADVTFAAAANARRQTVESTAMLMTRSGY